MFLRSYSNKNSRNIWFDIETTGFNIFHGHIIEIAAVDNFGNEFSTLIKCPRKLSKKIIEITHITDDMLKDQPDIKEALVGFINFIKMDKSKHTYLIGHNIYNFDIPFVKAQCAKYNLKLPKTDYIDTMRMSQLVMEDQYYHNLNHLCDLFRIKNTNAHRALSDVYATRIVYQNLVILFRRKFKTASPGLIINKTQFV
jgi:DNA polymerase III epsilon subunit family exonuclease